MQERESNVLALTLPLSTNSSNETVSLGDTAISLHTLQCQLGGGGVFMGSQNGEINSGSLACSCIADSLSHTTCVETNELNDSY